ncbi:endonuclease/exonuclease/phosphatase family protein [Rubellimicrobium sp. CFH 75288]|uniref:endonuclease/exonuclease/phosphatase family protein n=1 Tax=Rubellimicrobium sp. CFH 75288 TaxID=2697034 RepID=UPI0014122EDB|nr:endonuclease/exonuclease/phosphatase family protein [Rubellimicrobium sp. CFH 75288]NAZ37998.1 endonuclease/exonuclease/phosphatase [Rubellimicrobium sp. CFH 75288]
MRPLPVLLLAALPLPAGAQEIALRVLSLNIWGAGLNEGAGIEDTVAVLRAAEADLVGLQEVRAESDPCLAESCPPAGPSVGAALAEALGLFYHEQTEENPALWAGGILSRWPVAAVAPHDLGVAVDLPDGRRVWLFNIHLDDEPYGPYQLLGIPYGPSPFTDDPAVAIATAEATRGPALDLLEESLRAAEGAAAVFVTGDFNEPSDLDWTPEAAEAGLHPVAVDWPASRRMRAMGFTDAYRAVHPDPVARPAFTWTARGSEDDPEDHHDRIDFVYARGEGLRVEDAWIMGETGPRTDLAVDPWPSDHRGVLAELRF